MDPKTIAKGVELYRRTGVQARGLDVTVEQGAPDGFIVSWHFHDGGVYLRSGGRVHVDLYGDERAAGQVGPR